MKRDAFTMSLDDTITFGSVCSGIEAASVAWNGFGWRAAWLAEIELFPCAMLAHHYPDVPNLGNMLLIPALLRNGDIPAPDVFTGGTPCFTAGHMVLCSTGYKAIETVEVGDLVVSHTGRLQRVLRIGSKTAHRGKPAADGPRYKALGNSWAVPNVRWIGKRIDARLRAGSAN